MNELKLLQTLRDDVAEPTTEQLAPMFATLEARMRGKRRHGRRRARARWVVGALVAATGMVAVGGMAASGGAFTNPEAGPLPEGVDVVTQEVYDDAYAKFEACMNEGGASLAAKREVGGVHEFSFPAAAQPVYDKCYVDFAPIDFRWQIAHSYDSATFVRYRECLTAMGIEPGKDADTVLAQVKESGLDVRECFEPATNG